ncbi:hypothetical protein [Streptomyces sp. Tu 3180]|uniref:hypothetical protein n=1 Tax=Streptomyces sp. Tu 3180 TaxID=2682611 RepID=UPI001FB6DAF2|nr:hypothetical protein [Streptomyces sp. Tu 3180]
MEKWREDAQPERLGAAGAFEEFPENDEDRDLGDTRLLPEDGYFAGPGARGGAEIHDADAGAGTGFDSLEDRWARLGVLPTGNDGNRAPGGASRGADPAARPGTRPGDARRAGAAFTAGTPDGTAPADGREDRTAAAREGRADDPWDAERTTALRVPRPRTGAPGAPGGPGARVTWPSSPEGTRTPARDPWQEEPAETAAATHDATHDPHEVTVQLDAVQFGDGGVLRRSPDRVGGGQDASAGPVFVDESGRRVRLYRRIGLAVGLACAGYAVVMVATLLSGNSDAPWMPVPGQQERPAGKVETSPRPAETDAAPGSGTSLSPGATPATGAPTAPGSGVTAPGSGTAGAADEPGTGADPAPAQTPKTPVNPGTGDDDVTPTTPDETPTAPVPDPTVTDDPAPGTTAPTGGGDGGDAGTDDVAGAPAGPPVVAEGPAAQSEPSATPAAPSPENVL